MDKRALMDERRKKWMQDRETSLTVMETKREMSSAFGSSNIGGQQQQSRGGGEQESVPGYTDMFLNKLTDKLASHIREEVRKEIQNSNEFSGEDLAEKMDTYLQDELSTHTCKICFELMESDKGKTPILLFPCGHTFCESCINSHAQTQSKRTSSTTTSNNIRSSTSSLSSLTKSTCPYCRTVVDSAAINQALKDLICQFSKQRKSVIGKDFSQLQSSHRRSAKGTDDDNYDRGRNDRGPPQDHRLLSKYSGQLRSCEMRYTILTNELDDARRDLSGVDKKKKILSDASAMLLREKNSVQERMRQLEEELQLIDKHLHDQEQKRKALEDDNHQVVGRIQLTEQTLNNLYGEMEKLKVLCEGLT